MLVHATWDYTAANAIAVPAAEVAQVEETGALVSIHGIPMAHAHPPIQVQLLDDTAKLWKSKCLVC